MKMAKAIAFLVFFLVSPAAYATNHTVGDTAGWTTAISTSNWATGQTFAVGDNLLFNYGAAHGLDIVSDADFTACTTSSPLESHPTGPTTISLNATGTWNFICPRPGHCGLGQKLTIRVTAAGSPGASVPATPSGTPATPGTPPVTAAPSAARNLGSGGLVSLVLMSMVGLMC